MVEAQVSGPARDLVVLFDRFIYWLSRHWLAVVNIASGVFSALPVLAPILLANGLTAPANAIYSAYQVVCHQMPSRSFFLAGFQMAYCQRNFAIYTTIFLAGMAYALWRKKVPLLPLWAYVVLILPMAIDGFTQLFGLRLSTPELRVFTGTLFGGASVWLAYPYLDIGFADIRRDVERQLAKVETVDPLVG